MIIGILSDTIISGIVLIATGAIITAAIVQIKGHKAKISLIVTIAASLMLLAFIFYGVAIHPRTLSTTAIDLEMEDYTGAQPLTFTMISDIHIGKFYNSAILADAISVLNSQDSDFIIYLGDMVNGNDQHLSDLDMMSQIENSNQYLVYGNHDYFNTEGKVLVDGLSERIATLGIIPLRNSAIEVGFTGETRIILAGVDDTTSDNDSYEFLRYFEADDFVILACHNPDCAIKVAGNTGIKQLVDLIVAGHTHGGEIQLPIIGPLLPPPTELGLEYDKGLFYFEGIPLYITSGVGTVGTRARTFNPPEIVTITIR